VTNFVLGPRALARNSSRPLRRFLSTETDSISASTENSLKQIQSIEAQLNTHLQQGVPSVDPETHGTSASVSENVAQQYYTYKQQCTLCVS
jgi:small subunit ribosomal protein S2